MSNRTYHGWMVFYFIDIILMFFFAVRFYEWNGIWILEGVLAGLGFVAADFIWTEHKERKKKKE